MAPAAGAGGAGENPLSASLVPLGSSMSTTCPVFRSFTGESKQHDHHRPARHPDFLAQALCLLASSFLIFLRAVSLTLLLLLETLLLALLLVLETLVAYFLKLPHLLLRQGEQRQQQQQKNQVAAAPAAAAAPGAKEKQGSACAAADSAAATTAAAATAVATPAESCLTDIALYRGTVVHLRRRPKRHRLAYSVRMALVNLDDQPAWFKASSAPLHLTADEARGLARTDGPVFVLTNPVSVGYEQNPISVYYCYGSSSEKLKGNSNREDKPRGKVDDCDPQEDVQRGKEGSAGVGNEFGCEEERGGGGRTGLPEPSRLQRCIAEVTNTPWNDRVRFVFSPNSDSVPKPLHVSPFMDMESEWSITATAPAHGLRIVFRLHHPALGKDFFLACLDASIVKSFSPPPSQSHQTQRQQRHQQHQKQQQQQQTQFTRGKQDASAQLASTATASTTSGTSSSLAEPLLSPEEAGGSSNSSGSSSSISGRSSSYGGRSFSSAWLRSVRAQWFLWLMPHQVAFWIYWHAFLLWWKGVPLFTHPKYSSGPDYRSRALAALAQRGRLLQACCPAAAEAGTVAASVEGESKGVEHHGRAPAGDVKQDDESTSDGVADSAYGLAAGLTKGSSTCVHVGWTDAQAWPWQ